MSVALQAVVEAIEHQLRGRGTAPPADAFLIGAARHTLAVELQRGTLDRVAALHWQTFHRLFPRLADRGPDALLAVIALSLPEALVSGVTTAVMDALDSGMTARPQSVMFKRLTRSTAGHIVFRTQLLRLAEAEFRTTPLEMTGLLQRHTPAAIRAMLHARLIKGRPDLDSDARQALVTHATRHLGRLLSEATAARHMLLLLRLAYHRLHHSAVAVRVMHRLRIVDFNARRGAIARVDSGQ